MPLKIINNLHIAKSHENILSFSLIAPEMTALFFEYSSFIDFDIKYSEIPATSQFAS